jgi:hypothetical protein
MDKDYIISIINLMFGLTNDEQKEMKNLSISELEEKYKLYFLEKSEEML